jgi:purine-binding chemotaxis protein CheW
MLILRIGDRVYGTIVDKIDKVVGITSSSIQPPHPIFGDINIKFISGVVEKQGDLYIILDVIRIFTQSEEDKNKPRGTMENTGDNFYAPPPLADQVTAQNAASADSALGFIKESLPALRHFYPSGINDAWLRRRFTEWSNSRTEAELQLKGAADADDYLAGFASPCTGNFWNDDYAAMVQKVLPALSSNNIQVWNIGCGKGYETFSFACILKLRYPEGHIKIWANDSDIMAISQAPNMSFDLEELPEYCRGFMVSGKNGYNFNQAIKDSVVFEYHDVLNENSLPSLDIILARDILSFFSVQDQEKLTASFAEKLKNNGLVILGRNEQFQGDEWRSVGVDPVSAFLHNE